MYMTKINAVNYNNPFLRTSKMEKKKPYPIILVYNVEPAEKKTFYSDSKVMNEKYFGI